MRKTDIKWIQTHLLHWYELNARDLPWRRTRNPYKIWVSEIMLQQTQVQTVIPYYGKWMRRFPTVQRLAKASFSDVLKYWAGLGYYRRAHMLYQAAKIICKKYNGAIPYKIKELLKLPGVGPYTAGAVASIAFRKNAAILDGNITRILTRIYATRDNIQSPKTIDKLWKISASLVPEEHSGDFNQAMMELGAIICSPKNPLCHKCPIDKLCKSHQLGHEIMFPVKKPREKIQKFRQVALILRNNEGKILIHQQPKNDRWGGLWTFPYWDNLSIMLRETNIQLKLLKQVMTLHYSYTKYRIRLDVYKIKGSYQIPNTRWVSPPRLICYPFPSPHQKIADSILK